MSAVADTSRKTATQTRYLRRHRMTAEEKQVNAEYLLQMREGIVSVLAKCYDRMHLCKK